MRDPAAGAPLAPGARLTRRVRTAAAIAALGPLFLAACTVPRPVTPLGAPRCNLVSVPLIVDLGSGHGAAADASPNPLSRLLVNAALGRLPGPATLGTGDDALPARHLVLSGGGQHGAFGTGFLAGMDPLPDYDVVTGVSTGSLQAPLALLGNEAPPDDRYFDADDDFPADANQSGRRNIDDLVSGYTITRQDTLYRSRGVAGLIRGASLGDLEPLRRRIATLVTDKMLRRLGTVDRHKKGLFVLLLNWDTGNAEQVDMLELASRYADGQTHLRRCFIEVLVAAASEPLGTPPVPIDDHLYVDAGLRFGVFARDAAAAASAAAREIRAHVGGIRGRPLVRTDMIRNGDLRVKRDAPARYSAIHVMKRGRTILVNQIYAFSMRDVLDRAGKEHQVRFAFITPEEVDSMPPAPGVEFDPVYMRRMIAVGRGRRGRWNVVSPQDPLQ